MMYPKTAEGLAEALAAAGGDESRLWMDIGAIRVLDVAPLPVPTEVSMRQARLALHKAALLTGVEAALAALPEPQRTAAKIEWEFATTVRRDSPLVTVLGTALGLDAAGFDNLFLSANAIP